MIKMGIGSRLRGVLPRNLAHLLLGHPKPPVPDYGHGHQVDTTGIKRDIDANTGKIKTLGETVDAQGRTIGDLEGRMDTVQEGITRLDETVANLPPAVEGGYPPANTVVGDQYNAKNIVQNQSRLPVLLAAGLIGGGLAIAGVAALALRRGDHKTILFPQYSSSTTNTLILGENPLLKYDNMLIPTTASATSEAQSDLECVVTRAQLREAVKDKQKLDKLAEVLANTYSGVALPFATSTQQPSLDNAKRYFTQLTDGKRSPADKLKGISANPELVSMRLAKEGEFYVIKVGFEETNSAGQKVSKTGEDAQSFYLIPATEKTYAPQFCNAFRNLK